MCGRIFWEFIDELFVCFDVVEVIDCCVLFKKVGKDFKVCCFFHNEKTFSFIVSRFKQFYHCFGCGVSGTVIMFFMEFEHLSFFEVIEELVGEVGLEVFDIGFAWFGDNLMLLLLEILGEVSCYYKDQLCSYSDVLVTIVYLK